MVCAPECDAEHYCDVFLGDVCAPCRLRCFINHPYPGECQLHCPVVYKRMYEAVSTAATTEQAVTTAAVTPYEGPAVNNTSLIIILECVIAVTVIIYVVAFMCYHRRRHRQKKKESTEKSDPEVKNGCHELTSACSQSPGRHKYSPIRHETDSNQAETTLGGTMLSQRLPLSTANSSSDDDMPSFLFNNGTEFKSGHRVLRKSPKPRDSLANMHSREPLLRQERINDSNQHDPHQFNIRSDAYTSNGRYPTRETSHNLNVKNSQENVSPMLDEISAVHEGGIAERLENGTEHEPPQLNRTNNISMGTAGVTGSPGSSMEAASQSSHFAGGHASMASTSTNSNPPTYNFISDPMESGLVSFDSATSTSAARDCSGHCQRWDAKLKSTAGVTGSPGSSMEVASPRSHFAGGHASMASTNSNPPTYNFVSDPMESGIVSFDSATSTSAARDCSGYCQRWDTK